MKQLLFFIAALLSRGLCLQGSEFFGQLESAARKTVGLKPSAANIEKQAAAAQYTLLQTSQAISTDTAEQIKKMYQDYDARIAQAKSDLSSLQEAVGTHKTRLLKEYTDGLVNAYRRLETVNPRLLNLVADRDRWQALLVQMNKEHPAVQEKLEQVSFTKEQIAQEITNVENQIKNAKKFIRDRIIKEIEKNEQLIATEKRRRTPLPPAPAAKLPKFAPYNAQFEREPYEFEYPEVVPTSLPAKEQKTEEGFLVIPSASQAKGAKK